MLHCFHQNFAPGVRGPTKKKKWAIILRNFWSFWEEACNSFLPWAVCFEIKISQGRMLRLLSCFTKFMECNQSFMFHQFPSDDMFFDTENCSIKY